MQSTLGQNSMPQGSAIDASQQPARSPAVGSLRLIVHADDFGISERVNAGVIDAHRNGILTSASIMASAVQFEQAVQLARETPSLDIGVHLTLAEERPLLDPGLIPSLVDDTGCFHRHATVFAKRYAQGKIDLEDVRRELEAQVAKVMATGLPVSHLDSHQHLHMLPGVLRITRELAIKHGIPCIRYPRETIRPYMFRRLGQASRIAQLAVLNIFCRLGQKSFTARTDHFVGFYHGGALNRANLAEVVAHLPRKGVCELMCHPGHDDPGSERAHWGYNWPAELEALLDREIAASLRKRGVALISYRDLATAAGKTAA